MDKLTMKALISGVGFMLVSTALVLVKTGYSFALGWILAMIGCIIIQMLQLFD